MNTLKNNWQTSLCFFVAALCGYLATLPQLAGFAEIFKAIVALATALGGFFAADRSSKGTSPEPIPDNGANPKEP